MIFAFFFKPRSLFLSSLTISHPHEESSRDDSEQRSIDHGDAVIGLAPGAAFGLVKDVGLVLTGPDVAVALGLVAHVHLGKS